ncbi:hypothetical protein GRF29_164g468701 [Pseudopithomyces chartarum]|uniref:DUF6594 domain-containing protein n=1 Tax=Pseudopithomyces chartarum TaxID=1892770 RepID=A0AAN6LQ19_9PLEO|nr:hypothetical protein GRF29_164g468701 [Pseudopithomyces chartarum]
MPDVLLYFNTSNWRLRRNKSTNTHDLESQNQTNAPVSVEMGDIISESQDRNLDSASRSPSPANNVTDQTAQDHRYDNITFETVNDYPKGYPRWAAYQNSDANFGVYRRFGTVRHRLLLYRQQELYKLERELFQLDKEDEANALLECEHRSSLMQKASKRDHLNLVNYLWNQKSIVKSETEFTNQQDDFIKLSECSESPLESFIDYVICNWVPSKWLRQQFTSQSQMSKFSNEYTILTSPRKIFILSRIIASALAIGTISVPLAVLVSDVCSDKTKLVVLMVSVIAFPAAIQLAARPRTLELFVATATYCAVLTTVLATSSTFSVKQLQSELAAAMGQVASNTV